MANPKITFTGIKGGRVASPVIEFQSWQQRPMRATTQVEGVTRLGGHRLIISPIKTESNASGVTATIVGIGATVALAIQSCEDTIEIIRKNIGTQCTFTDENNIVTENCYIMNIAYNIVAVDGAYKALGQLNMTLMNDDDI